ncbi:MAG: hypothetical protein Q8M24_24770 [Pseudolabrys sp.]|nr:hypothetical protein [Pseudolabrys sp.]
MSILLYGVGALVIMTGAVMIGIGVPVNEFSFGNTMIVAGTTTMVGGLIIVALGIAVGQLQRIAEALAQRAPLPGRAGRPPDMVEPAVPPRAGAVPTRVPFPPKPKSDAVPRAAPPVPVVPPAPVVTDEPDAPPAYAAPMLRNPDQPPSAAEDEVSLSPQPPAPAADSEPDMFDRPAVETAPRDEPALDDSWRLPPPPEPLPEPPRSRATAPKSYFDAMWPAEPKRPAPEPEPVVEAPEVAAAPEEPAPEPDVKEPERRNVEILKSGVVDGMAYTLYVDGSIEAELPQGTLHFASINDLRDHLERNA